MVKARKSRPGNWQKLDTDRSIGLGVEIEGNYEDAQSKINCSRSFIVMAFRAIINNAVKFSRGVEGNRYLKIDTGLDERLDQFTVTFESSTKELIPEDKLDFIFKPYASFTKSQPKSRGLGLFLADSSIKLHGGGIVARNIQKDRGLSVCIEITLPIFIGEDPGVLI